MEQQQCCSLLKKHKKVCEIFHNFLQLNKLKSKIKSGTEVTLNLSSNVVGDSKDETSFLHK